MDEFKSTIKVRDSIVFKSIGSVVALLFIFSAIIALFGYQGVTEALSDAYKESAFRTAKAASMFVDADKLEDFKASGGKSEEYQKVWEDLDRICNNSGSAFVYVIQPDTTDYKHIMFLFSTMNKESHYDLYSFGYVRETTNNDYRKKYKLLYEGKVDEALVVRDKGYIETDPHITAMVPLLGSDQKTKGILCVQKQMDVLTNKRNIFLIKVAVALLVTALLLVFGQSRYLHRVLLEPLTRIITEATRFAKESVPGGERLQDVISNEDEIGELAEAIDQMEEQICNYVEDLTRATAERERMQTEMALAAKIQSHMLPDSKLAFSDREEFDIYASMVPAKEVGGDFYDFFLIDEDHLCMIIADVSDKGVPAALFMMSSKIIVENYAKTGISPAEVLEKANNAICANNQDDMFVTVWLGILEISTGKVTAANAGHEYPAIMQPGEDFILFQDRHGFVLGGMEDLPYQDYEVLLKPGAKLFVYTDGLPEATNVEAKAFGADRMIEALNKSPEGTPREILDTVRGVVDEFVGDANPFDDLTMLCLEYKPFK